MDQESRDANTLLAELDRGLQSPNIGEQSVAVSRFNQLFQKYALPIVVNSAYVKLSEAFVRGSNFIRIQVCEVFELNQDHLNKIYNVDDFYRNLFNVTTSNDPIARSITLLTLGNVALVVRDHKSIHHCISSSLESKIEFELKAAITCAASLVKHSSEFACNIYPKIVSIVDSPESPMDIKIKALSVFDHGFYNANGAMVVRSFLIEVMNKSNLKKLTSACLTLSTKIAYTSLSHIPNQIDLLIKTFLTDERQSIRFNALRNLKFLAENSPHIWESSHVDPLVSHLESVLSKPDDDNDDQYSSTILALFCKLLNCRCNFISQEEKSRIFKQCYKLALNRKNIALCTMAFELLTVMAEEHICSAADGMVDVRSTNLFLDTYTAIEHFINDTHPPTRTAKSKKANSRNIVQNIIPVNKQQASTKTIYRHLVKLCKIYPKYCSGLLCDIINIISNKDKSLTDLTPHMTELMCAITQFLHVRLPPFDKTDVCWKIIKARSHDMSDTNLLNLFVVCFQILNPKERHCVSEDSLVKVFITRSLWFMFKVMRQAMRYGHHDVARMICDQIHDQVTTDTMDFYFKGLGKMCLAESNLLHDKELDANLNSSIAIYEDSVSPLRVSMSNSQATNFQLQFLLLRIRYLQCHRTLRQCCKVYSVCPITYATLLSAIGATRGGGEPGLARLGLIQQIPKVAKDFRYLAECYENLSSVSFNCDNCTLDYLHLLKCGCVIMADAIDAIFQYGKNLPIINKLPARSSDSVTALEHRDLEETFQKTIELIKFELVKPGISPSVQTIEPLISLLNRLSDELLGCPFKYPRYFFQPLQMIKINLTITPQPNPPQTQLQLISKTNFVLKVEGLIQNLSKSKIVIRNLAKVVISVTMIPLRPSDVPCNFFVQSVAVPQNDYFRTEFLLPLKYSGTFNVEIEVSVIDEDDCLWKTGPKEMLGLTVS